jgi:putative ABC transport system permease protein
MIHNYFRIAWRNILKRGFYSFLNITGLVCGLCFTFLIGAYVWNEINVNRQLKHANNQYILTSKWNTKDFGLDLTTVGPLAKQLKDQYPGLVKNYYRWDGITSVVSVGDKHFRQGLQVGDSSLLAMYGFKTLNGDVNTALDDPFSVVISKEMAVKYFGKTDVVGQILNIQSFGAPDHPFKVTAVLAPYSENSVMHVNTPNDNQIFLPEAAVKYFNRTSLDDWNNIYVPSYIELADAVTARDLEKPISDLLKLNSPDWMKGKLTVIPIPLTRYYLDKDNGFVKRMLYTLSAVALFILLMAMVNFINISISSSSSRIREIGVRKALGGLKKQIIIQFLAESVILAGIATLIALLIYPLLAPVFSSMLGKQLPGLFDFPLYYAFVPLILVLLVGGLAGFYPAIVLSRAQTVDSLKGKLKTIKEKVWLRKSLAGLQFGISAVVIIAAVVVSQQVTYFFNHDMGYDKEYVVSAQAPRYWTPEGVKKIITIRNEFEQLPQVSKASVSWDIPDGMSGGNILLYKPGQDSATALSATNVITDENYLATYKIALKAGTFFTQPDETNHQGIILNEKAINSFGWHTASEAIGQSIRVVGMPNTVVIGGVVANFNIGSMQREIPPMIFLHPSQTNSYRYLSFKIKPGQVSTAIGALEKKWSVLLPGTSFEYKFMDDTLKNLYQSELRLRKAAYVATLLSVVIVLLGILGIISLSIRKRTKEIGIRKVLGASVPGIILLFLKEFLWVIVVAGLVACPLAWYIMNGWLADYAYRINMNATPFLLAVMGLALLTTCLIILQIMREGLANPVKSLRVE